MTSDCQKKKHCPETVPYLHLLHEQKKRRQLQLLISKKQKKPEKTYNFNVIKLGQKKIFFSMSREQLVN